VPSFTILDDEAIREASSGSPFFLVSFRVVVASWAPTAVVAVSPVHEKVPCRHSDQADVRECSHNVRQVVAQKKDN
jgi:hypothetical protein